MDKIYVILGDWTYWDVEHDTCERDLESFHGAYDDKQKALDLLKNSLEDFIAAYEGDGQSMKLSDIKFDEETDSVTFKEEYADCPNYYTACLQVVEYEMNTIYGS